VQLPAELDAAIEELLSGIPVRQLTGTTTRLIEHYQGTVDPGKPVLRDGLDGAAYAAYRMPATYAAIRAALREFALLAPAWQPKTHLDVGGGTGAAAWAAAVTWPELAVSVIMDRSGPALATGRELARRSTAVSVRAARWTRLDLAQLDPGRLDPGQLDPGQLDPAQSAALPAADLATASYVLGELAPAVRDALVDSLAASAEVVGVVEPGTPEGYRRILAARTRLIAAGMSVVAPCPHSAACPLEPGADWCHFAVRINRSSVHRQVKNAALSYEDEKYSYVVASRTPYPPAAGRVLRHPLRRDKLVQLTVCSRDDGVVAVTVPKSQRETYRAAKDASWGTAWP
jgi:ribosomal protein RSM22 (predicted rRNA methylase)